jgi:hypothetical protein
MSEAATANADIVKEADAAVQLLAQVRAEIGKVVFGQERVVELVISTILAGGHALLIGAPGLAKTKLVETTAKALGLDWGRVQFTPDLMPSDILGSEILDETSNGGRAFRFVKGPIFTSLLMADEINRASPRTQSALLQAMQERHVTVAGASYDLPKPFHVLATQNPIEQEGTYPLPEAQLDRFLLKVDVDVSRPGHRTPHSRGDDRPAGSDRAPRARRGTPARDAGAGAPHAGSGKGPRSHSPSRALGATGTDRSSAGEEARRLGSVAARWPGADAGGAFARAAARPPCAFAG